MVKDDVGDIVAGMDVANDPRGEESSIEEELYGEAVDTKASGAEMGGGRRDEPHEDSAEEDCGPKRVAPDPGMPT